MLFLKRKWKKGDEKQYKFITNKISFEGNTKKVLSSQTKIIEIDVLKNTESESTIDWTEYTPPKNWFQRFLANKLGIYTNFSIDFKYRTDEHGAIEEIIIDDNLTSYLKEIQMELKNKVDGNEVLTDLLTQEYILRKITPKIKLFHLPYGLDFSDDVFNDNTEFENMIFEDLGLPRKINSSIVYFDEKTSIGEIQFEKKYDQLALKENLEESISRLRNFDKDESNSKLPPLAITERYWYKINYSTGWLLNAKYERGIMTKLTDNIQEINIELIE